MFTGLPRRKMMGAGLNRTRQDTASKVQLYIQSASHYSAIIPTCLEFDPLTCTCQAIAGYPWTVRSPQIVRSFEVGNLAHVSGTDPHCVVIHSHLPLGIIVLLQYSPTMEACESPGTATIDCEGGAALCGAVWRRLQYKYKRVGVPFTPQSVFRRAIIRLWRFT